MAAILGQFPTNFRFSGALISSYVFLRQIEVVSANHQTAMFFCFFLALCFQGLGAKA